MNQSHIPEQLDNFNLETMSGIFPGTRTRWFHLLHLLPAKASESASPQIDLGSAEDDHAEGNSMDAGIWAKAFWFEEPATVVVTDRAGQVFAQIEKPNAEDIFAEVRQSIENKQRRIVSCGTCQHWDPTAVNESAKSIYGTCGKRVETAPQSWPYSSSIAAEEQQSAPPQQSTQGLAQELAPQSAFSLNCPHWENQAPAPAGSDQTAVSQTAESTSSTQNFGLDPKTDVDLAVPDTSGVSQSPVSWVRRVAHWLGLGRESADAKRVGHQREAVNQFLLDQLNRSGVGAGTEPCLGCHGRIANLGALIVETAEGDKQTFSVWRCRNCAATYLNSWIDRWERLDNLETEEALYRIAPAEALILLERIHDIKGGDHPQAREKRGEERLWFEAFLNNRSALSHQVRHGR